MSVRKPRHRAGIHAIKVRTPTDADFSFTLAVLEHLGAEFLSALAVAIGEHIGRPASITARHGLAAWLLAGCDQGSKGQHATAARNLIALTDSQRAALGVPEVPEHRVYPRLWSKITRVIFAIEVGFDFMRDGVVVHVDRDWFRNAVAEAAIPDDAVRSLTLAVDGTDWEAAAAWVRPKLPAEYDGAVPPDTDTPLEEHQKAVLRARRKLRDLVPSGPDGRPIYTTEYQARAGHRSANFQHSAGLYVGYELHAGVQVADFKYNGKPGQVSFDSSVDPYVRFTQLSPAGAHRNDEVVPGLIKTLVATRDRRAQADARAQLDMAVILDRGYTCLSYESGLGRLAEAGIGAVFDLTKHQRGLAAKQADIVWIDGTPFHALMPKRLYKLPQTQIGDSAEDRDRKQKAFDERARWRWTVIGPTENGEGHRLECPFCAGRLRAQGIRQTKVQVDAPTVILPAGATRCCSGRVSIKDGTNHLEQAQGMPYHTTAQRKVYNQRPEVENTFNVIKHQLGNLGRDYTRLKNLPGRSFALAFLFAGVNHRIAVSAAAKAESRDAYEARLAAWEVEQTMNHADKTTANNMRPTPARPTAPQTPSRPNRSARRASTAKPLRT